VVLDGWIAPILVSFLGIVVVWFSNGIIHHAILEYIQLVSLVAQNVFYLTNFRLTEKHNGVYLAMVVANCLKWFGLEKLVCFLFSFFFFNPS
jgi:uncharacterized membrane protein YqgA involved in biofilm formation